MEGEKSFSCSFLGGLLFQGCLRLDLAGRTGWEACYQLASHRSNPSRRFDFSNYGITSKAVYKDSIDMNATSIQKHREGALRQLPELLQLEGMAASSC